jgi:hypothetical protein
MSCKVRQDDKCPIWLGDTQRARGRESFSGNDSPLGRPTARKRLPTPFAVAVLAGMLLLTASLRTTVGDDSTEQARQRLSAMSAAEKQELEAKRTRFYSLPESDQQRLRQVHQELSEAEDGERLRQVMQNYAKWLRSLQSGVRAELVTMPPESRVERIKELLQEQENWRMRKYVMPELSAEDRAVIVRWMEEFVTAHEQEILERLPHWKPRWETYEPSQRLNMLIFAATTIKPVRELLLPDDEEMQKLKTQLSAAAKQELSRAEKEGRLAELAERWSRAAMLSRHAPPQVSREELQRFYSELSSQQREYLENLSAERMEQELTRLYHFSRFRRFFDPDRAPFSRPGDGGRGRSRGGWPGGERPPGPPGEHPGMPRFGPGGPGGPGGGPGGPEGSGGPGGGSG